MALSRLIPDSVRTLDIWLAPPEAAAQFDPLALSPADRERWRHIRGERSRREWAVSRALLHRLGNPPAANFSLSHSAGHAAVVRARAPDATDGLRLGIDLEAMRPRDILRLAAFAFTDAEAAQLAALDPSARHEHFYLLWTLKEAFTKALGLPLLEGLRRCAFLHDAGRWRADVPADACVARVYRPRSTLLLAVVAAWTAGAAASSSRDLDFVCHEWPAAREPEWNLVMRIDELPIASAVALT